MFKTVTAAAAVLFSAALVLPTVSHAEDVRSVTVSYADLDLVSGLGQQTLERRISFAARSVCDLGERSHELDFAAATSACRAATIADAQPSFEAALAAARRGTVTVGGAAALIVTAR